MALAISCSAAWREASPAVEQACVITVPRGVSRNPRRVMAPELGQRGTPKGVQRILVPVDFSGNSARALDYAAGLACLFGATIEVLHVWSVPSLLPEGRRS